MSDIFYEDDNFLESGDDNESESNNLSCKEEDSEMASKLYEKRNLHKNKYIRKIQ